MFSVNNSNDDLQTMARNTPSNGLTEGKNVKSLTGQSNNAVVAGPILKRKSCSIQKQSNIKRITSA